MQEKWRKYGKGKRPQKGTYGRMLALAAHALAEVFAYLHVTLLIVPIVLFFIFFIRLIVPIVKNTDSFFGNFFCLISFFVL